MFLTTLLLPDRHRRQTATQWMSNVKRQKPCQMTLHLPPLWTSPSTGKVTYVCQAATSPGPHRISRLTVMPTRTRSSTAAPNRTSTVQVPRSAPLMRRTFSQPSMSPASAPDLQITSQDLSLPGLKGATHRPRGTASFHSPHESRIEPGKGRAWTRTTSSGPINLFLVFLYGCPFYVKNAIWGF